MVTSSSSSPSSSISSLFIYPKADVVSANLLVEGIRLSGGSNIVERCERLWYSDSTYASSDSTYVSPSRTGRTDSSVNKDTKIAVLKKVYGTDNKEGADDTQSTQSTQSAQSTQNGMDDRLLTVKALHLLNNRGAPSFPPEQKVTQRHTQTYKTHETHTKHTQTHKKTHYCVSD